MKNRLPLFLGSLALLLALSQAAPGQIEPGGEVVIPGKVVTGFNSYLGQPVVDFPGLGIFRFEGLGVHNPGGTDPLPLAPSTSESALLATFVDPIFLGVFGIDPSTVDPSLINVPLRQVQTVVGLDDETRAPLPASNDAAIFEYSQAGPAAPIDLAAWRRARGVVSVQCHDNGTSLFRLAARHLIPSRIYTVWGAYLTPVGPVPIPFGGVPNAFVTDQHGSGSIMRTLNDCPLAPPAEGEPLLLGLELMFHSDLMLNGAVPAVPLAGGVRALGAITHPQLAFRFAGSDLLEPEGWSDEACEPSSTRFCLSEGRFQVEMTWTDFDGNTGSAHTLDPGSDDSGLFYFFDRDNWEVVVKVLDGCGFNDHFWVFFAAATNVEYELTVTDTRTSETKVYENPLGAISPPVTDTTAFATCP